MSNNITEYRLNQRYNEFILSEGVSVHLADDELQTIITFSNPTYDEIFAVSNGTIEFGVYKFDDKIPYCYLTLGNMNPMDCLLLLNDEHTKNIGDELALKIILANNINGEITALRAIKLPNNISQYIRKIMLDQEHSEEFRVIKNARTIQNNYSTNEIVRIIKEKGHVFSIKMI